MSQYVGLLRDNGNYRFLWLGSVITQLGDWFNLIASAELITNLTNSGVAISYLFLARFLPLFLFSPLAGVLADRYDRRRVMIATDVLRAGTVLCFLLVRSPEQVWLLYVLTVVQFTLSSLFTPARSAVLSNIVARRELVTANALDSLTWSTMLALGAFLGGVIAAVLGIEAAFVLDALTFLLSAFFIGRIVVEPKRPTAVPSHSGGWFEFVEGLRYLRGVPFILAISLAKGAGSLVWGSINVLEVTFADQLFPLNTPFFVETLNIQDGGTATLGWIYMVSGLGTGLGPLLLRRWLGDAPSRMLWGITLGFALLAGGILSLSLAPTLLLFSGATLLRTVGSGGIWVFSAALLQTLVPDRFRGRVFAFEFALLTLTQSVSIFVAGYLQDTLGWDVRFITAVMGGVGVVVGVSWFLFHIAILRSGKSIRDLAPDEEAETAFASG